MDGIQVSIVGEEIQRGIRYGWHRYKSPVFVVGCQYFSRMGDFIIFEHQLVDVAHVVGHVAGVATKSGR